MSGYAPPLVNVHPGQFTAGAEPPYSAGAYAPAPVGIWITSRASITMRSVFASEYAGSVLTFAATRGSAGTAPPVATVALNANTGFASVVSYGFCASKKMSRTWPGSTLQPDSMSSPCVPGAPGTACVSDLIPLPLHCAPAAPAPYTWIVAAMIFQPAGSPNLPDVFDDGIASETSLIGVVPLLFSSYTNALPLVKSPHEPTIGSVPAGTAWIGDDPAGGYDGAA